MMVQRRLLKKLRERLHLLKNSLVYAVMLQSPAPAAPAAVPAAQPEQARPAWPPAPER